MAFDLGVFLTVVGVVMLTLANLARVGRKAEPPPAEAGPMDIVLRARGPLRWSCWSPAASAWPRRSAIYLVLRAQTFPLVLGLTFLSYAVNIYLFAMGRLVVGAPPIVSDGATAYTDPLPQALVLTAIVISFGMTALLVVLALRGYLETGDDHVDGTARAPEGEP